MSRNKLGKDNHCTDEGWCKEKQTRGHETISAMRSTDKLIQQLESFFTDPQSARGQRQRIG